MNDEKNSLETTKRLKSLIEKKHFCRKESQQQSAFDNK